MRVGDLVSYEYAEFQPIAMIFLGTTVDYDDGGCDPIDIHWFYYHRGIKQVVGSSKFNVVARYEDAEDG